MPELPPHGTFAHPRESKGANRGSPASNEDMARSHVGSQMLARTLAITHAAAAAAVVKGGRPHASVRPPYSNRWILKARAVCADCSHHNQPLELSRIFCPRKLGRHAAADMPSPPFAGARDRCAAASGNASSKHGIALSLWCAHDVVGCTLL